MDHALYSNNGPGDLDVRRRQCHARHGSSLDRWTRITDSDPNFQEPEQNMGNYDTYKEGIENVNSHHVT